MDKNEKVTNVLITIVILIAIFVLPLVLASHVQKNVEPHISKGQKACESRGGYISVADGVRQTVYSHPNPKRT